MQDFSQMKLGRGAMKVDARNLLFRNYLPRILPAVPKMRNWGKKIHPRSWGMMLNDNEGDCTIATTGHMEMNWSVNAAGLLVPTDADIQAAYIAVTAQENNGVGYDPATGMNDNGCSCLDVLNYWYKFGISGKKIANFVQIDPTNIAHIKMAIELFGSVYLGINLPLSAQTQNIWAEPKGGAVGNGAPGSWGGHAVPLVGFSDNYAQCITWGQTLNIEWNFFPPYVEEAYAAVSEQWLVNNLSPDKYNIVQLQTDANAIKQAA